jgi:molybdopterin/thiamine biosynthesis adenylyltransferase
MEKSQASSGPNINFRRQQEIYDPRELQATITIVGIGNIGSQTALGLARLGLERFNLYDHDEVEEHNLSSQSFFLSNLGEKKVQSISTMLQDVNRHCIPFTFPTKFSGKEFTEGVLIIAVDSMKERHRICANIKKSGKVPSLIIDGRMGGSQLEIYTCTSFEEWEETFTDTPSRDSCGARYICYTSMIIGALISNQVKRFLKEEKLKKQILFDINSLQLI